MPECRVLINAAGGAIGREPVEDASDEDWRAMYESNVIGTLRMTRALLPVLEAQRRRPRGDGGLDRRL